MKDPKWIDHMLNICWLCGVSIRKGLIIILNTWAPLSFSGASLSRNLVHWRLHDGHLRYTLKIHGPHGVMDLPKKWTIFVGFIFCIVQLLFYGSMFNFPWIIVTAHPPQCKFVRERCTPRWSSSARGWNWTWWSGSLVLWQTPGRPHPNSSIEWGYPKKYAIELVGFIVWVQRDDAMVMNHDYKNWTPNRINRWKFPLASSETWLVN